MKSNTTSVTVTIRLNNDDIKSSIAAVQALAALLAESLANVAPAAVLEVQS